jgi:hypothetical protein
MAEPPSMSFEDIFEFGVIGLRESKQIVLAPPYWSATFPSAGDLYSTLGLNRLITKTYVGGRLTTRTLGSFKSTSACGGDLTRVLYALDSLNASPLIDHQGYQRQAHYLVYLIMEAEYHLLGLAESYSQTIGQIVDSWPRATSFMGSLRTDRIADHFPHLAWLTNTGLPRVFPRDLYGRTVDPLFFEMTACLTALKRALNQLPVVLNASPVVVNTFQASYSKLIEKRLLPGRHELPEPLATALLNAWQQWAELLVQHRDYLEHYAIPSALGGAPCAHMIVSKGGRAVCLEALLPDNPAARRHDEFTFERGTQYLSYCHECYDNLLALSHQVVSFVFEGRLDADRAQPEDSAPRSD